MTVFIIAAVVALWLQVNANAENFRADTKEQAQCYQKSVEQCQQKVFDIQRDTLLAQQETAVNDKALAAAIDRLAEKIENLSFEYRRSTFRENKD